MSSDHAFDLVFDCQRAFRRLLDAMARPGRVFSIREAIEKLDRAQAELYAAALTLLDNRCRFYVHQDAALAEALWEMTYAVLSPADQADYLFVPLGSDMEAARRDLLPRAKTGTLAEPHKSATFFVSVPCLTGKSSATLLGPGVDGRMRVELPDEVRLWVQARNSLLAEPPCGIELYFLTPAGDVLCIPRKVKMEED